MQNLRTTITSLYGKEGANWLQQLPDLLKSLESELQIRLQSPFTNLSYHYVAPGIDQEHNEIILKVGIPNYEFESQINALQYFDGHGCVKLYHYNIKQGWLLLEKCSPGIPISHLEDRLATAFAVDTMQKLWRDNHSQKPTLDYPFKHIRDWLERLNYPTKTIPNDMLLKARTLSQKLLDDLGPEILLHGDCHHENILSSQREAYLVIDPKGVIGEREFELGAFMRNPYSLIAQCSDLKALMQQHLAIISELTKLDPKRIKAWSFVQAILSACWHEDDNTEGKEVMIKLAHALV